MKQYVVKPASYDQAHGTHGEVVWYCHDKRTPNIPVFGSIGDKAKAERVCRMMNGGRQ